MVELPRTMRKTQLRRDEADESRRVPRARILAVNDEPRILGLIREILANEGYVVDIAEDGRDALQQTKTRTYDLLLVDIHMPYIGGFELYEHIQRMSQPLASKVIFMTAKGNLSKKHVRDFLSKTKVPCITMPFDVQQFKQEINRMLSPG